MSTIFNRIWTPAKGSNRSGMLLCTGSFTVGSSGAVDSSDTPGFTVTKESQAGLYTIQLVAPDGTSPQKGCQAVTTAGANTTPWAFQAIHATVVSAVAAGTALTTSSPFTFGVRTFMPDAGHFAIQFFKSTTSSSDEVHTDANLVSGSIVLLDFQVKLSSVTP